MSGKLKTAALLGAIACGASGVAVAETTPAAEMDALRAELAAMRAEMGQMRQAQGEDWLNERRAEEVKGLIRDVLADADTRASLLDEGALAGIDEKGKIFLRSADDKFYANIGGQIQVRYIWNNQSDRGAPDGETEEGIQFRRVKVGIKGHIGDPKVKYALTLAQSRGDSGDQDIDQLKVAYKFNDAATVAAGFYKVPFLRQEVTSSSKQIAVDRASITEAFTLNKGKQVSLSGSNDLVKYDVAYLTTVDDDYTDFTEDKNGSGAEDIHFGVAGRATFMIMGDSWKALGDYNAWPGKEPALFVGVGGVYLNLDDQAGGGTYPLGTEDYTAYTIDASYQGNGLTLNGAFMANNFDGTAGEVEQSGFLAEAAYFLNKQFQPFVRYEWGDDDNAATDDLEIVTVGFNYYLAKHNSKFTVDVACKLDGDFVNADSDLGGSVDSSGLGFRSFDNDEDQIALRAQYQLKF